ncbi:MAG: HIT family protein [Rhodospirillaceae bacterium]
MGDQIKQADDCIFCKITRGEIPSFKVAETDEAFAFMDINPIAPGHTLVIPKHHAPNIYETPGFASGPAMAMVSRVAAAVNRAMKPEGINILQANGPGAKQSVFHTHFHIIPRRADDGLTMNWEVIPGDMDTIKAVAEKIRAELAKD